MFIRGERGIRVKSSYLHASYCYISVTLTFNSKPLTLVLTHAYASLILSHHGTISSVGTQMCDFPTCVF